MLLESLLDGWADRFRLAHIPFQDGLRIRLVDVLAAWTARAGIRELQLAPGDVNRIVDGE